MDSEIFQVPFPPNNNFVGRHDILDEIEAIIRKNQTADGCVPTVLKGLGGMGKSQLMLKYCYAHRKEYKYTFWIKAEGNKETFDEFRNLAEDLGIKASDEDLPKRIRTWFQSRKERWLLLLDNVDAFEDVFDFIPHFGGDVIVTTRNHINKSNGSVIHVDKMAKADALLLLLGPEIHDTPPADAVRIVEELDCMPLAVEIARAYIDRTHTSFKAYLEIYNTKHAFLFRNEQDLNRNHYSHNIATVWDLSFKRLRERSKLATLIIGACAFLHPDAIPVSLFERQSTVLQLDADSNAIREAVGILVQFSFVRRTTTYDVDIDIGNNYIPARDLMTIHRLVQEVIRESIAKDVGHKPWGELLVMAMKNEVTSNDYHNLHVRKINDVYIPNIRNVIKLTDWHQTDTETQSHLNQLLHIVTWYLCEAGALQSSMEFALTSLSISEALDSPSQALSLSNLASVYFDLEKYCEAKPLYQQAALAIMDDVLGPDHPDTEKSRRNLAIFYIHWDKYDEAESIYKQALAIREKVLGPDHPDMAKSRCNLATFYNFLRNYDKAEPLYQEVVAIFMKRFRPDLFRTTLSHTVLSRTALSLHSLSVDPLFRRAPAIEEAMLGSDKTDTAIYNLALAYFSQSKYEEAEPKYQRSLAIFEKVVGPDHSYTALCLESLAELYFRQGKHDEAEPMYQRSLAIFEKAVGPEHTYTASILNNLAELYFNQGKYDEAEPLYQRALETREVLWPNHPDTASSLNNLAELYFSQGKYDKAEPLYQRALAMRKKVLGQDHPSTAISLGKLAALNSKIRETRTNSNRSCNGALVVLERYWSQIVHMRRRL